MTIQELKALAATKSQTKDATDKSQLQEINADINALQPNATAAQIDALAERLDEIPA